MHQDQDHRQRASYGRDAAPVSHLGDAKAIPFGQRLTCTIAEACAATGLGRTKLYELIGAGYLDTTLIGRRRLVLVRSLRMLLDGSAD